MTSEFKTGDWVKVRNREEFRELCEGISDWPGRNWRVDRYRITHVIADDGRLRLEDEGGSPAGVWKTSRFALAPEPDRAVVARRWASRELLKALRYGKPEEIARAIVFYALYAPQDVPRLQSGLTFASLILKTPAFLRELTTRGKRSTLMGWVRLAYGRAEGVSRRAAVSAAIRALGYLKWRGA